MQEKLENARKTLKILGIVCVIFGIIGILMGGLSLAGGGLMAGGLADTSGMSAADAETASLATGLVLGAGIVLLFSGIFTLLMGIFSVRGANDFSKVGAAYVFAIINLVVAIAGVVIDIIGGGGISAILANAGALAFSAGIFWAANTIKQANQQ